MATALKLWIETLRVTDPSRQGHTRSNTVRRKTTGNGVRRAIFPTVTLVRTTVSPKLPAGNFAREARVTSIFNYLLNFLKKTNVYRQAVALPPTVFPLIRAISIGPIENSPRRAFAVKSRRYPPAELICPDRS
jgi:hypothetical protein